MKSQLLSGKITVVVGGTSAIGMGIVRSLLEENATVIVPSNSADEIAVLKDYLSVLHTGKLVSILTDIFDYDKVTDIAEDVFEEFGRIDLVVTAFENNFCDLPLTEIEITDWQKILDEKITAHFVVGRVSLHLMKEQGGGVFVNVCDLDVTRFKPDSSLSKIAEEGQEKLSVIFSREVKPYNIRYYHLMVNNVATRKKSSVLLGKQGWISPEMIGNHIVKLYLKQVENPDDLFQQFLGRQLSSSEGQLLQQLL